MLETGRSHVFAWVAAGVLVLALAYRVLSDRAPEPPPVTVEEPRAALGGRAVGGGGAVGGGAGGGGGAAGDARGPRVYVHVAGAGRRPGRYRLPQDARVAAAIARAGGPRRHADLTGTNLAARVADGQQIVVGVRGRPVPAAGGAAGGTSGTSGGAAGGGLLSLASATQAQLEELDGIGPTLAARILEYRDEHGGFRSVDELAEVDGIGEVRLEALRQAVQP